VHAAVVTCRNNLCVAAPLFNTLRQRADALARPLIWLERHRLGEHWHTCIDYSPLRAVATELLNEQHERTMRAANAESIEWANLQAPWGDDDGAGTHAVMPSEADLVERPIWALPACVARFGFLRDSDEQRKEAKRCVPASDTTLGEPPLARRVARRALSRPWCVCCVGRLARALAREFDTVRRR
jgi:hypothetical protein